MKFFAVFSVFIFIFSACQSSPEDIAGLFRAAGVDLEVEGSQECAEKQLDIIYDEIGEAENKAELLNLIEKKGITKVVVSTIQERTIECNQAIIDLNAPVKSRSCDPGTYTGTLKNLQSTQIDITDGIILLTLNAQELTKHFYVYASDSLLVSELPEFEKQIQKSYKGGSYLSFDTISDLSTQYGLSIKKLSHFPETYCGHYISLKDLLLRLSL